MPINEASMRKVVKLPTKDEMLQRLCTAEDALLYEMRLYPMIVPFAEFRTSAEQLVIILFLAMQRHTEGMPKEFAAIEYERIPALIRTLVDDESFFKETKEYFDREMTKLIA